MMNTQNPTTSMNIAEMIKHARRCSRYVARLLDTSPELESWLSQNLGTACTQDEMTSWLNLPAAPNEETTSISLRLLRKKVMLKLITRDLCNQADLHEVTAAMTSLAELSVQKACECAMLSLNSIYGTPLGSDSGSAQDLLVIGMGKLGGGELNVSSDIDLIFTYPEDGKTSGDRSIDNAEFFTRIGRKIITLINEMTADGYVFRVDMRLRPYGDSGALVTSFAALEEYFISQGREWERYAWIKARVVFPQSHTHVRSLEKISNPFIYRKYLDFGAFESMRKLHAQIRQEVQRRDRLNNIKLGPGGIREIEFIAQVFQLIRGGRETELRVRATLAVLQLLSNSGQISPQSASSLRSAYIFLRNLEHRLQYLDDQQTQELPSGIDDQETIALAMGYQDYKSMLIDLDQHREIVSEQFGKIFSTRDSDEKEIDEQLQLWQEGMVAEELGARLAAMGYLNSKDQAERLVHMRNSSKYLQLPDISRQRLDRIMPLLIATCADSPSPDLALPRSLKLIESISKRASYLAFMSEYPQVLGRLSEISSSSEWAADYLVSHPFLLDELLAAREIYEAPDWHALDIQLTSRLAECEGDIERAMNILREFQQTQTFHLLAMDLRGLLPLENLSDHLSDLADLILEHVLQTCWQELRKKHQPEHHFAIIAYGKLGGKELGYASDLDLIFLYEDPHPDAAEIYARLAQRINTVISSHTSAGRLYETDLRLRPNGASGLLVSSINAFEDYQHRHAWVWEHQALTRARFSAGDALVGEKFEAIRQKVLCQPRAILELRKEVISMRHKMHEGHPNKSSQFDIKHDNGGMVDIEFMVQFIVLAYSSSHPELTANIGNLAILQLAGKLKLVDETLVTEVQDVYRHLRQLQHRIRLNQEGPCRIAVDLVDTSPVIKLWQKLFPES